MSKIEKKIVHPLLDVQLPTMNDLYGRCADEEVKSVLKAACHLAAYRCLCAKSIKDKIIEYQSFPSDENIEIDFNEAVFVKPIDMVRALIATQSQYLQDCLFNSYNSYGKTTVRFFESSRYWKEILKNNDPKIKLERLEEIWARRWALRFIENTEIRISKETLVSSVLNNIPAEWVDIYEDGLAARGEVFNRLTTNFYNFVHDFVSRNGIMPLTLTDWLPEAYYDKMDLFQSIPRYWIKHSVVFLVFLDDFSKQHFLKYLDVSSRFPNISPFGKHNELILNFFVLDSYGYADSLKTVNDDNVYVFGGNLNINHDEKGWVFDSKNEVVGPASKLSLTFFGNLLNLEKGKKILIAINQQEYNQLSEQLPEVIRLFRIDIPKLNSRDLIPFLIVQFPKLQLKLDFDLKFGEFLNALLKLHQKYQDEFPEDLFIVFEEIIYQVKLDRAVRKAGNISDAEPFSFMNLQTSSRVTKRRISYMLKSTFAFFIRYIGDINKLQEFSVLFNAAKYLHNDIKEHKQYEITEDDYLFLTEKQEQIKVSPLFEKKSNRQPTDEFIIFMKEDTPSWKGELLFSERLDSPIDIFKNNLYKQDELNRQKAYIAKTKQLAESSIEQATRLAIYISSDHSWYKKLSVLPNDLLYIFLNTDAGKYHLDIDSDKLTQEEYQKEFGHYDYRVTNDTKYMVPNLVLTTAGYVNSNKFIVSNESLIISSELLELARCNVSAFLSSDVIAIDMWYGKCASLLNNGYKNIVEIEKQLPENLSPRLRLLLALLNQDCYNADETLRIDNPLYAEVVAQRYASSAENHQVALETALKLGGREHYSNVRLAMAYKNYLENCESAVLNEQKSYLQSKLVPEKYVEIAAQRIIKTYKSTYEIKNLIDENTAEICDQILSDPEMAAELTAIAPSDGLLNALITEKLISHLRRQEIESHQRTMLRKLQLEHNKSDDLSTAILTDFDFSPVIVQLIRKLSRIHIKQIECIVDSAMEFHKRVKETLI